MLFRCVPVLRKLTIMCVDKKAEMPQRGILQTASLGPLGGGKVYNWVNPTGR